MLRRRSSTESRATPAAAAEPAAATPDPTLPHLAFAGAGTITVLHGLAAQVLRLPVALVASRSSERARTRAEQLDAAPAAYEDLPGAADLVIVATPPDHHASDARRALENGVSALVEKPLCTTLADADALVALDVAGPPHLAYAENLLHAPAVVTALAHVAELGPLVHLEASALQSRPEWGDFFSPERGGGVLFDLGVHPLSLVLQAAGAPVATVSATLDRSEGLAVDDHAEVTLTFTNGLTARVATSWSAPQPVWDLQAASDTGVVRLELVPSLGLERDGEPVPLPEPTYTDVPQLEQLGYTQQLASAVCHVRAGTAPELGATFGRTVLEVVCAAYRSAGLDGAPQPMPFTGPRDQTPLELWLG